MLPAGARPNLPKADQNELTDYATGPRYPGWGEISIADARRAVGIARRLRREARNLLPKAAFKPRRS